MFHHHVVIQLHCSMEQLRLIFEYNNLLTTLVLCSAVTLHIASSSAQWQLPIRPENRIQHWRAEETRPRKWTRLYTRLTRFHFAPLPQKVHPLLIKRNRTVHMSLVSPVIEFPCSWICLSMYSLDSELHVSFLSAVPVADWLQLWTHLIILTFASHFPEHGSGYSRKQQTEQTTGGHEEGRGRGFYSPEDFPFPVTRKKICMGYARFSVRI